jgi:hypothetical protein
MGKASRMKKEKTVAARGKQLVAAVGRAISEDDPSKLAECLKLAERIHTSIWDVRLVLKNEEKGFHQAVNPIIMAVFMECQRCFDWLLMDSWTSEQGNRAVSELFVMLVATMDSMPKDHPRYKMAKSLILNTAEKAWKIGDASNMEEVLDAANGSSDATSIVKNYFAKMEAMRQQAEIVAYLEKLRKARNAMSIEDYLALHEDAIEPNQEAVIAAGVAVNAAMEASSQRSKAKSL